MGEKSNSNHRLQQPEKTNTHTQKLNKILSEQKISLIGMFGHITFTTERSEAYGSHRYRYLIVWYDA